MKVAHLIGNMNRGGAEMLALSVFSNAKKNNLNVICIYRNSGALYNDFVNTGIQMFKLTPNNRFDLIFLCRLRKLLKKEKVDIIHVHQVGDIVAALLATWLSGIKVVYTLHGFLTNRNKVFSGVQFGRVLSSASIYVSNFQMLFYKNNYKTNDDMLLKSHVVYNGIDFKARDLAAKQDISELDKNDRLRMCMVGSFTSVRNQFFICQFLEVLHKKGFDFDFYFIGGKSDREIDLYNKCYTFCVESNILDKVHFIGVRDDVPSLMKQMDAFIYASAEDTFGIAVVEAIATGVPVFVNDWDVMREITNNGEYACLYKTNDINDLFVRFTDFVFNHNAYKEKAQQNAEVIRKLYDINNHIENLKSLYQNIL